MPTKRCYYSVHKDMPAPCRIVRCMQLLRMFTALYPILTYSQLRMKTALNTAYNNNCAMFCMWRAGCTTTPSFRFTLFARAQHNRLQSQQNHCLLHTYVTPAVLQTGNASTCVSIFVTTVNPSPTSHRLGMNTGEHAHSVTNLHHPT
jgi:hypothetical protein